ncbi:hypothetical protein AB0395_32615 [Streptosporangium sp. NPDC051023]|uniref:hypothetical protein n=1 Tax=Streptosporangium sp. NPDC051023 TaxID=3155410 RepID=UPI00344EF3B3
MASELSVAARGRTGSWTSLGVDSGTGDYPDVFSARLVVPDDVVNIGASEVWISEPDLNNGAGASLRLLEFAAGESITKIVCSADGRMIDQEISPLRIALIGFWSELPVAVHAYTDEGVRRDLAVDA